MNGSPAIGIIAARNKPEAQALAAAIGDWLATRGVNPRDEAALLRDGGEGVDLLIVLGGDGLMVRCGRMFPGLPLLGVNFGHVGFLTMVERRDWVPALERVLARDYRVQRGPTLQADLVRDGRRIEVDGRQVINDVVIRSGPQLIELELYINGQFVNLYPGDGMIVATPQGSTAYCMSAGGPILTHGVRGFAVMPLNPHSPIRIPLVIEEEALVELVCVSDRPSWLYLDGSYQDPPRLVRGDIVQVRRGEHPFALVLLEGMSFYNAVRDRFNFLIRPDTKPSRPALHPPPPR